jgi:maleate isomerase
MKLKVKPAMVDSLGYRLKLGVVAPSTNTSVQPEYDGMRPPGVTNHFSRIHIPDEPIRDDRDFGQLMDNIRKQLMTAIDNVMTCRPEHLILGMSSETFWDGLDGANELKKRCESRAGISVTMGSDACQEAIRRYGDIRRIGVITPYMPLGDGQVRKFFADCGFEIVHLLGLRCASPTLIAHVSETQLRDALLRVNDSSVEAIVQVGTNLAMARLAGIAEFWLDKPVIAINTATYWWALRKNGIEDKVHGFGSLLIEH